ncbi:hypothetical protein RHO15_09585 [Utexia brackfieldae]|uniref:hypothetical protein n=1 Tax=Utexia brackfieldae TaxID=3074108 RepID=UPI00370D4B0D
MKRLLLVCFLGLFLFGCNKNKSNVTAECEGATMTGKIYNIMGSGHFLYNKNNEIFEKIIDQHMSDIYGETQYRTISYEIPVIEKCTFEQYSYVEALGEYKTKGYSGWVETSILDKGQELKDPYIRLIDTFVTSNQYKPDDFKDLSQLLGNNFPKVNSLRFLAAKAVVDAGRCGYVIDSNIDPINIGTKENLRFVVECKGNVKISIDEKSINSAS